MLLRRRVLALILLSTLATVAVAAADAPSPAAAPAPAPTDDAPDAAAPADETPHVLMYTTQNCGYCERARAHLRQRHVAWREIDIETSAAAQAEFAQRGGAGTPLIFVAEERVLGFDVVRLDDALERHHLVP